MLEMRPNCECCGKDLPPQSTTAWICSMECSYCDDCANTVLEGRCPNCGGGLAPRPPRRHELLQQYPASTQRVVKAGGCKAGHNA